MTCPKSLFELDVENSRTFLAVYIENLQDGVGRVGPDVAAGALVYNLSESSL